MPPMQDKVWIYLLRFRKEIELLVFEHTHINAGIQIPAGTVKPSENIQAAAQRELQEEAGVHLATLTPFGEWVGEWDGATVCAHWYWAWAPDDLPEEWTHHVTGDGKDSGMKFHYYWLSHAEWPKLFGDFKRAYAAFREWRRRKLLMELK